MTVRRRVVNTLSIPIPGDPNHVLDVPLFADQLAIPNLTQYLGGLSVKPIEAEKFVRVTVVACRASANLVEQAGPSWAEAEKLDAILRALAAAANALNTHTLKWVSPEGEKRLRDGSAVIRDMHDMVVGWRTQVTSHLKKSGGQIKRIDGRTWALTVAGRLREWGLSRTAAAKQTCEIGEACGVSDCPQKRSLIRLLRDIPDPNPG